MPAPMPDTLTTQTAARQVTRSSGTREQRQARIDARVARVRANAAAKQALADKLSGDVNNDPAFWTQPAYGNRAGRAFAHARDRARAKMFKAAEIAAEAKRLRDAADAMERRGAVMAGDAAVVRAEAVAACEVAVGQIVDTTHFGLRKVVKVNRATVLVEGAFGPLKVEKQFIRAARKVTA